MSEVIEHKKIFTFAPVVILSFFFAAFLYFTATPVEAAAVTYNTGGAYWCGPPCPADHTVNVGAAADNTFVIVAVGGDLDNSGTGWAITYTSGWRRAARIAGGGNGSVFYWNGSGNPPNLPLTWAGFNDRAGVVWASYSNVASFDFSIYETTFDVYMNGPPHTAVGIVEPGTDRWVVASGWRDVGSAAVPAGWTMRQHANHWGRGAMIQDRAGTNATTEDPLEMTTGAVSVLGLQATVTFSLRSGEGDCTRPIGGDFIMTVSCKFPSTIDGVDNGNLIIRNGTTLTINPGQIIAWNPGFEIALEAGSIAMADTGSLSKTRLWMIDNDNDAYSPSLFQTLGDSSPGGTYKRRYTLGTITITDCDDADNTKALDCTPTPPPPEPPPGGGGGSEWGTCTLSCGKAGTCLDTSACGGTSTPGYCPGPANIQCCTSGGCSATDGRRAACACSGGMTHRFCTTPIATNAQITAYCQLAYGPTCSILFTYCSELCNDSWC